MRTLVIEPLTKEAFAPFGDVIETDGSDHFMINNGSTMRFHRLATVETAQPDDKAIISIFRADAQDMPLDWPLFLRMLHEAMGGIRGRFFALDRFPLADATASVRPL